MNVGKGSVMGQLVQSAPEKLNGVRSVVAFSQLEDVTLVSAWYSDTEAVMTARYDDAGRLASTHGELSARWFVSFILDGPDDHRLRMLVEGDMEGLRQSFGR